MIIYEVTSEIDRDVEMYKKSEIPSPEYLEMTLEEFSQIYPKISQHRKALDDLKTPKVFSWIHSWYIDELQERLVKLTAEGNLEGIKEAVAAAEKDPEYLATIRFCSDGFATKKYEKSEGGAFSGYSLLNVAIFKGHEEIAEYLVKECGMNPNEKCYANPIWTAAFPSVQAVIQGGDTREVDEKKFRILRKISEDFAGGINFEGYRSGKAEDTVFHLAARIPDHSLREEALDFFRERAGDVASLKNMVQDNLRGIFLNSSNRVL
jgi:hypothetical protein